MVNREYETTSATGAMPMEFMLQSVVATTNMTHYIVGTMDQ